MGVTAALRLVGALACLAGAVLCIMGAFAPGQLPWPAPGWGFRAMFLALAAILLAAGVAVVPKGLPAR